MKIIYGLPEGAGFFRTIPFRMQASTNQENVMIRIAIQAKGRLNEESLALLAEAGIAVEQGNRRLRAHCGDFPLEVLYLRDDDIPHAVASGVADLGIVGLNEVEEKGEAVGIVRRLGKGRCRLSLAVPEGTDYRSPEWFGGRRVATSYPRILSAWFDRMGIRADIRTIAGSVEIAPSVGMADAIFDIVSSGGTLVSNGLKEVEQVMQSEAVLVATPSLSEEKRALLDQLIFRMEAVERSRGMKYVMMNIPCDRVADATAIVPGMKSPTVLPLALEGWCSMHMVVRESELWERLGQLKNAGAEDILVLAMGKMIP